MQQINPQCVSSRHRKKWDMRFKGPFRDAAVSIPKSEKASREKAKHPRKKRKVIAGYKALRQNSKREKNLGLIENVGHRNFDQPGYSQKSLPNAPGKQKQHGGENEPPQRFYFGEERF